MGLLAAAEGALPGLTLQTQYCVNSTLGVQTPYPFWLNTTSNKLYMELPQTTTAAPENYASLWALLDANGNRSMPNFAVLARKTGFIFTKWTGVGLLFSLDNAHFKAGTPTIDPFDVSFATTTVDPTGTATVTMSYLNIQAGVA